MCAWVWGRGFWGFGLLGCFFLLYLFLYDRVPALCSDFKVVSIWLMPSFTATVTLIGNWISVKLSFTDFLFFVNYSLHNSSPNLFFLSFPLSPPFTCLWREGIKGKVTHKEEAEKSLGFSQTIPFSTFESQYDHVIKCFEIWNQNCKWQIHTIIKKWRKWAITVLTCRFNQLV